MHTIPSSRWGGVAPQSRNMVNLAGTIDNLNNTVIAGVRGTNDAYDPDNKDYVVGESCIYNNIVYLAKVPITKPAGAFDPSKWDESSLKTLMEGVNANASAISDITTLKSTTLRNTTYMASNASIYRVGPLVFFTYYSDLQNIPAGSFNLGAIPQGFRPINTVIFGERDGGKITFRVQTYGDIECYNYSSAMDIMNGQFSACWLTTNPLPN